MRYLAGRNDFFNTLLAVSVALHLLLLLMMKIAEDVRVPKFSASQNSIFHLTLLSISSTEGARVLSPVGYPLPSSLRAGGGPAGPAPPAPQLPKVDKITWIFHTPQPRYPEAARENSWEGEVTIEFKTDQQGYVESLEIVSPSGHPLLDEEAYQTVKQWRVAPLITAKAPIVFRLKE